jgi:hypothetical protein
MKDGRPNIIVVGVGHSGTSIVTKLLHTVGWQAPQADSRYYEHVGIRKANTKALATGRLPDTRAIVKELNANQPWVVKDPRFTVTLSLWHAVLQPCPLLLWLTKDIEAVKRSYVRRKELLNGKPGNRWRGAKRGYTVEQQLQMITAAVADWSGPVVKLDYTQIAEAAALFKPR